MPILPKDKDCCGCSACFCACSAITMQRDELGFFYPLVLEHCTECKLCEIVCPALPHLNFAPYNEAKKSSFPFLKNDIAMRDLNPMCDLNPDSTTPPQFTF